MSDLFLGLAILSVAWGIVSSIVIASFLSQRGIKINLLFFRILVLRYIHQYHQITRRDDTHNIHSVTKSFTSALVGIAIDRGMIGSVDEKVFDFFPEHADLMDDDSLKAELTIEDLLTMRSGIDWDDETYPYDDPRNDLNRLFAARNPIRFILFKDILVAPGTVFQYSNCNSDLLGDIVHRGQLLQCAPGAHPGDAGRSYPAGGRVGDIHGQRSYLSERHYERNGRDDEKTGRGKQGIAKSQSF